MRRLARQQRAEGGALSAERKFVLGNIGMTELARAKQTDSPDCMSVLRWHLGAAAAPPRRRLGGARARTRPALARFPLGAGREK